MMMRWGIWFIRDNCLLNYDSAIIENKEHVDGESICELLVSIAALGPIIASLVCVVLVIGERHFLFYLSRFMVVKGLGGLLD